MTAADKRLLGAILVDAGALAEETLDAALALQRQSPDRRLGAILAQGKKIGETALLAALGKQFGMEVMTALPEASDHGFADLVPARFLREHLLVPVQPAAGLPFLAMHDPLLFAAADDLEHLLGWPGAQRVLAPSAAVLRLIHAAYERRRDSVEQVIQTVEKNEVESLFSALDELGDILDGEGEAPVIRLANLILAEAVKSGASDIHVEPYRDNLLIRQRVDGVLYDMLQPPPHVHAPLVSRLKIMARLDIAEQRLPQDGRIAIRVGERTIDIRMATLPTTFGERVVLRLLDKSAALFSLDHLGMTPEQLALFRGLLRSPGGIILVTGPTGSGKTTTLYSALQEINRTDINIITIEDPVEYQLDGIGQIQVNPKINLTFAGGLRAIVRQDPDVILIGEIRDRDTADIAIQAAMTGHLVFSTLHTNDAAGAVTRLVNMGIEPFLISSSVLAIVGQRLLRVICPACRTPVALEHGALATLGIDPAALADASPSRGVGCPDCMASGYRGRRGIFEVMVLDEYLQKTILAGVDAGALREAAIGRGMRSMEEDGRRLVLAGETTVAEVLRVLRPEPVFMDAEKNGA